jgi:hypothetical protein
MNKITEFNKENLKALRVELELAHAAIEKKFGIQLKAGNISFSGTEVNIKLKANTIGAQGTAITKEAKAFDLYAKKGGYSHLKVGSQVNMNGTLLTIKGYNSRAYKQPIQLEANGIGYKCSVQNLFRAIQVK